MSYRDAMARQSRERKALLKEQAAALSAYYARRAHIHGKAKRQQVDGYTMDSADEARRYGELKLAELGGVIGDLKVHPSWDICHNGMKICNVEADFSYLEKPSGKLVVEDVKSERRGRDGKVRYTTNTKISRLKQKLMKAFHNINIEIVIAGNKR